MSLVRLRYRHCVICHVRGDYVKKENLNTLNQPEDAERIKEVFSLTQLPEVGSIYCKKHAFHFKNKDSNNNDVTSTNNSNNSTFNDSTDIVIDHDIVPFHLSDKTDDELKDSTTKSIKNKKNSNSYLFVDLPKTYNSHKFCFICKKESGE